jgi:hypothetical protein
MICPAVAVREGRFRHESILKLEVCWYRSGASWIIRSGKEIRGTYRSRDAATLDAVETASEVQHDGGLMPRCGMRLQRLA